MSESKGKKQKVPQLQLIPAAKPAFDDKKDQKNTNLFVESDFSSTDDEEKISDRILRDDPIIEMFNDDQIEKNIKKIKFTQESDFFTSQEDNDELTQKESEKISNTKRKKITITTTKQQKTVKNELINNSENPNFDQKIQQTEKTALPKKKTKTQKKTKQEKPQTQQKAKSQAKQNPTKSAKQTKLFSFANSANQRKIFEFGKVTNLPPDDIDDFYQSIQMIYTFFNKKKPIPLILAVIHQSAGNIYEAIHRIAKDAYDFDEEDPDFSYSNVNALPDDIEKYFF